MIEKCYYLKSPSINPYYNLALEDYLFHNIPADSMIFMLSQNNDTVMIGRDQNPYKECFLNAMELDHCYLARRESGGGAVYQDLGNLNFSFIMYMDNYDIDRQMETIIQALKKAGINAERNGRNDIEVDGYKISGSAYLTRQERCLHHGTLAFNIDRKRMARYLNVSDKKIKAKGYDSVASRTINIQELNPALNMNSFQQIILQTVANNYGALYEMMPPADLSQQIDRYFSHSYIYGKTSEYTLIVHDYYSFGELQMYVDIENGIIRDIDMFTDAVDQELLQSIRNLFTGMHVDDTSFRRRAARFSEKEYVDDMKNIYYALKRNIFVG